MDKKDKKEINEMAHKLANKLKEADNNHITLPIIQLILERTGNTQGTLISCVYCGYGAYVPATAKAFIADIIGKEGYIVCNKCSAETLQIIKNR